MQPDLITFKSFNDPALAAELTALLEQHGIQHEVEESELSFNPSFVISNELSKNYAVKIKSVDFELVNRLLTESETKNIDQVEPDHYLFSFSNEELMDILAKADEWSPFDYQLARKILTQRGVKVDDAQLADLHQSRIEDLKQPDPPQTTWIIIGYIFALAGGILGIFIGWHLAFHKKTLPDGERVFGYNENDRKQGKRIFYLSIVFFVIGVILKFSLAMASGY
jgi:hypothetical protein